MRRTRFQNGKLSEEISAKAILLSLTYHLNAWGFREIIYFYSMYAYMCMPHKNTQLVALQHYPVVMICPFWISNALIYFN